ncbi:hypothetical protein G7008_17960 [Pseudomonas psychrotolerans]|nr:MULTISPECIES: hypothetical protein [Pseudomonas]MBA1182394.1 hypothetical protein [Pseudomonas psychrotolerans]MBA1210570.1 hypothetical protein [Pseudomonas psychrotolerans]
MAAINAQRFPPAGDQADGQTLDPGNLHKKGKTRESPTRKIAPKRKSGH